MGTNATLGGVTLVNAKSVSWSLSVGVEPHQETFVVHGSDAERLRAMVGQPVSLKISGDGFPPLEVEKLYVVGEAPAPEPYLAAFYVQDGRYLWRRKWIYRHFNVPRRTGNRRLIGGIPTEIDTGLDSFAYADWSLRDAKTKWTARDALSSVLKVVTGDFYRIDGDVPDVPIQGLEEDDDGASAIRRLLGHVVGWDVVLDYQGRAVLFDANDIGDARARLEGGGRQPMLDGSEKPVRANLSRIRPKKIVVLFNREVELRIDSVSESESVTRNVNDLDMENVLPVPDVSLTITEGGKARTVSRGTWVPVRLALAAWNADRPAGTPQLTFDLIRTMYLSPTGSLELIFHVYDQTGGANQAWAARLSTLRTHWRLTYQIANKWMRRIKGLRAKRLGVYDPVSGVFAPAGVFMNYAIHFAQKGIRAAGSVSANVHGYPGVGTSVDGSSARQAPATLQIVDQDLGIVHIDLHPALEGYGALLAPGLFVNEAGAETSFTYDTSAGKRLPICRDAKVRGTNQFVSLSSSHRLAIVLTAIPASPNDEAQLHDVEAKMEDVKQHFRGLDVSGSGPEWTVRIGSGLQTARILWVEGKDTVYQRIFGVADPTQGIPSSEIPKSMVVNSEILDETAEAKAAELLSKLVDHYDGTKTSHIDPGVVPRGNISVVTHTLTPDGQLTTSIRASGTLAGRDLLAMLPDSVRTAVFRILPPVSA